jgi:hypothetical protein
MKAAVPKAAIQLSLFDWKRPIDLHIKALERLVNQTTWLVVASGNDARCVRCGLEPTEHDDQSCLYERIHVPPGRQFVNIANAVLDLSKQGDFPVGTIFAARLRRGRVVFSQVQRKPNGKFQLVSLEDSDVEIQQIDWDRIIGQLERKAEVTYEKR